MERTLGLWQGAIQTASSQNVPLAISSRDLNYIYKGDLLAKECVDFLGWTAVALTSFCRGDGAVIPPPVGWAISDFTFRPTSELGECRSAGSSCLGALEAGIRTGTIAVGYMDEAISRSCVGAMPYAAPCLGPGAHQCAKDRIAAVITALRVIAAPPW